MTHKSEDPIKVDISDDVRSRRRSGCSGRWCSCNPMKMVFTFVDQVETDLLLRLLLLSLMATNKPEPLTTVIYLVFRLSYLTSQTHYSGLSGTTTCV